MGRGPPSVAFGRPPKASGGEGRRPTESWSLQATTGTWDEKVLVLTEANPKGAQRVAQLVASSNSWEHHRGAQLVELQN